MNERVQKDKNGWQRVIGVHWDVNSKDIREKIFRKICNKQPGQWYFCIKVINRNRNIDIKYYVSFKWGF